RQHNLDADLFQDGQRGLVDALHRVVRDHLDRRVGIADLAPGKLGQGGFGGRAAAPAATLAPRGGAFGGLYGHGLHSQRSTTLPDRPSCIAAKPASNSSIGKRWVRTGETSSPLCSMAIILYQVSNISRP